VQRLRTLPLAVLLAVIVALAVVRLRRPGPPSSADASSTSSTTLTAAPGARPTGLAAPLQPSRAERDRADAGEVLVPPGGPRMIHGGPRHAHRSAARGPSRANVAWKVEVGGPVAAQVTTSPDEQTLYVATLAGSVVALSRADGSRRWATALGDRVYSTPLVHDDGTLYVGTDAKRLVALAPDGTVRWRLEVDGEADSGPVFGKDGLVIFAAGSAVYAARRGGDLAWRFPTRGKVYTSPAVTDSGLVVVGAQDHRVHAIAPSGEPAWSTDLGADVDGAAVIGDDGAITVGTDRGEVVRLRADGKIAWRTGVEGYVRGTLSLTRSGDVLAGTYGPVPRMVRVGPDGVVLGALAVPGTGAREFGIHGGALEDVDGTVFFGAQDDVVRAIGPDGTERFRYATGADVDAPLTLLSDGSLVVPSEDGTVAMLLP